MKRMHFIPTFLISLTAIIFLASCTNGDPINPTNPTPVVVQNNVQTGQWVITSFVDSGKDETNHFNGFTFTFGTTGTLTAKNGSVTNSGTWSVTDSNSNDDSPDNLDFNIQFNLTNDFQDLNEDWQFISQSAVRIELIHVSGGNGGTDYLTFSKI